MLIMLGVNVFPSALKDVISSFYPRTTGEMQILLDHPGPAVLPPLRLEAEMIDHTGNAEAARRLKVEIEAKIKAVLTITTSVDLVPAGSLPRFEMKGQLVRKLYERPA